MFLINMLSESIEVSTNEWSTKVAYMLSCDKRINYEQEDKSYIYEKVYDNIEDSFKLKGLSICCFE